MKNRILPILFILFFILPVQAKREPDLYKKADSQRMEHWVDSVFDSMSVKERIGQLFVLAVDVNTSAKNKELIRKYVEEYKVGGLLFTSGDVQKQAELTNYAQSLAKIPLMITMDGEWGLAMRLKNTTKFPINMTLGAIRNDSLIYAYGKEMGRQCRRMGIQVNFAPVLDVNTNPQNPVIGRRSFGENPEQVARKAIAYAKGLESEGIMAVGKHFPGHGDTSEDSHHTLPVVNHSKIHLEKNELLPFKHYIDAGLSGMMTGHLLIPALDSTTELPASLSPVIVDTLLQQKLRFRGLTFTDALEMKGASSYPDQALTALLAGNDILLKPIIPGTQIERLEKALENNEISHQIIEEKCLKVLRYKYILGLNRYRPIKTENLIEELNNPNAERITRQLFARSVTLLENKNNTIPFSDLEKRTFGAVSVGVKAKTSFQNMLQNYAEVTPSLLYAGMKPALTNETIQQLSKYNTIIIGIYSEKKENIELVKRACKGKRPILVFFVSPYALNAYKDILPDAEAVIMAYESTPLAQEYAAELLFGGIEAKGKLPVNIQGLYAMGEGLKTPITRLGYATPEEAGMDSRILQKIDTIIKEGIQQKAFPGCQILVARKGKIVYDRTFGYFDYAHTHPVRSEDVYDVASITKAIATVPAIMLLNDKNQININSGISRYIPEIRKTFSPNITIRKVLFHETGLPSGIPIAKLLTDTLPGKAPLYKGSRDINYRIQVEKKLFAHKDSKLRPDLFSSVKEKDFTIPIAENLFASPALKDTILNAIYQIKPFENKKYRYSDLNFVLLQKAVENITGESIDKYLMTNFFAPLGANRTTFRPLLKINRSEIAPTENDEFLRKQIMIGYPHDELACFLGGVSGNAGLFSNSTDMAKILQMMLNKGVYGGKRILTENSVKLFTQTKSPNSRRGLGFDKPDMQNTKKSPTCEEAPECVYGHTGYTGTAFWVDPENDLIFIFLSNRVYAHRWNTALMSLNIRPRIQSVIYQSIKD